MGHHTETLQLLRDLQPAAQFTAALALDAVDLSHSVSGNPATDPAAELYKPYHNGAHTRRVIQDARYLGTYIGVSAAIIEAAVVAAAAHDVVHDLDGGIGPNSNERRSIAFLEANYPTNTQKNFKDAVRLAILATACSNENNTITQAATELDYPSKKHETIAHIVAAADLARLWTPDGPQISHAYLQELKTGASGIPPLMQDVAAWSELQATLTYIYPNKQLQEAMERLHAPVKEYHARLAQQIQAGNVTTWTQIQQADSLFAQQHSM